MLVLMSRICDRALHALSVTLQYVSGQYYGLLAKCLSHNVKNPKTYLTLAKMIAFPNDQTVRSFINAPVFI